MAKCQFDTWLAFRYFRSVRAAVAGAVVTVCLVPAAAGAPTAPPSLATLLARHAPVLVLHPLERFGPVAVDGFLADADLERRGQAGWETVEGPLPAGGSDVRLDHRLCRAIEGVGASSCYVDAQAAHGSAPVAYAAAFRTRTRIALQYWLFYPYNDFSPTVPAGELWQVHEGDWESVSVLLDLRGRPLVVGLSSHCEGTRREWPRAPKRGARPLAYVALGSHANFFRRGEHRLSPRCPGHPELIEIIQSFGVRPLDHTAAGRTVRPRLVRISASAPAWMTFAGAWGEDAYFHVPGQAPIRYGLGPRGPAFHEQWQRPAAEVLSWRRA
jgi:hypothetical protein